MEDEEKEKGEEKEGKEKEEKEGEEAEEGEEGKEEENHGMIEHPLPTKARAHADQADQGVYIKSLNKYFVYIRVSCEFDRLSG